MRITNNILNETSLKSGIALSSGSLVNQLNGDSASDSIINSLGNKGSSTLNSLSGEKYRKLKEYAEKLEERAERLKKEGKDSVFEKARESGDSSEVYQEVKDFISDYNSIMSRLRSDTSPMGLFYRQNLSEAVSENSEALKEIGIVVDKNGKMTVDNEKLKTADLNKVESLFGKSSDMMAKLSLIAGRLVDNAEANLKSSSSQYNASGSAVDTLLRNFDSKS